MKTGGKTKKGRKSTFDLRDLRLAEKEEEERRKSMPAEQVYIHRAERRQVSSSSSPDSAISQGKRILFALLAVRSP